jgi:tetratricopeptide (TPR) repeat protein
VVTTRVRLSGLAVEGARFLELGPLSEDGAITLLARLMGGERVAAEADAARRLATLCGRLPIAVCASGARLALRPRWPVARLVRQLDDAKRRLPLLGAGTDTSPEAAFDVSYEALPAAEARLYCLLGLHPGPVFGVGVAAAVAAIETDEAAELLDELAGASLVEEVAESRYRFHDLLRLHAHGKAEATPEREAASVRIAEWYLDAAVAADLVVIPGRWHVGPRYERARAAPPAFPTVVAALDWLEAELPNIRAVLAMADRIGLHSIAWQLCEALWGLFVFRRHYVDWFATHETGLRAARACGEPKAEARMLIALCQAHADLHDFENVTALAGEAFAVARNAGHHLGEAAALEMMGIAATRLHRAEEGIRHFAAARALHERLGRVRGVAMMTRHIGEAHAAMGDHRSAVRTLTEAAELFAALPDPYNQMRSLTTLGRVHIDAGRTEAAIGVLDRALVVAERIGAWHEEGTIRQALADVLVATGDTAAARTHLTRALRRFTELAVPEADETRRRLEALPPEPGPPDRQASSD